MAYCCVPGCKSMWQNGQAIGVSLHEIPANMEQRGKWLKVISRKDWTPLDTSNYSRVCSLHFRQSDFKVGVKRRILLPTAVPSVFPTYPKYMQPVAKKLRTTANSTCSNRVAHQLSTKLPKNCGNQSTSTLQDSVPDQAATKLSSIKKPCTKHYRLVNGDEACRQENAPGHPAPGRASAGLPKARHADKGVQIDSLAKTRNLELRRWKNKYYHVVQKNKKLLSKLNDSSFALSSHEERSGGDVDNYNEVLRQASQGMASAVLLREQVNNFGKKRPSWSKGTIRRCMQWRMCSQKGYSFALNSMRMKLPSRFTLSRFAEGGAVQNIAGGFMARSLQAEASQLTACERKRISETNPNPDNQMIANPSAEAKNASKDNLGMDLLSSRSANYFQPR